MRKIPQRTCVVCRNKNDKNTLLRIVRDKEKQTVFFDRSGKANGRGCYVCRNRKCIEKIASVKLVKHHLNVEVDPKVLEDLKEQMSEYITEEV